MLSLRARQYDVPRRIDYHDSIGHRLEQIAETGFDELRIAQISADEKRDFLLFMVQQPNDQVYFYFSTVREGLKKAFVSIPSKNLVMPLDPLEAQARFRQEVRYWGDRIESRIEPR